MRGRRARDFSLERTQILRRSPEEVFGFFSDPWNLEAITPPWLRFRILDAPARLEGGSRLRYRLRLFGVPLGWRTEIAHWQPPRSFADVQVAGPYPYWEHNHRFTPVTGGTEVYDHVRYRVPGGPIAERIERLLVRPRLNEIFDYRRKRLAVLLAPGPEAGAPLR
ncbi:MAG: SRPBCC family protein [Actinomycetota bacterium]|nr:SRPBCC family protein [Actinomycetota bacterium]